MDSDKKAHLNVKIPDDLKRDLKVYADRWNLTLEALAAMVFADFIQRNPNIKWEFTD